MISVTPSPRRIASHYLLTRSGLRPRPLLTLADDGTVVGVDTWRDPDRQAGVEFYSGILLPGMVNAHCHLELSCLRGAIPAGGGFAAFARGMGAQRGRFDEEQRRRAIEAADARMWREGVAAVGDVANGESTFAVKARSAIRYRTFAELFGLQSVSTAPVDGLLRHAATSLTPHSTYSVPDALFRRICSGGDAPLSIHFMESPAEEALYRGEGELAAWYAERGWRCDFLHYGSPVERLVGSVPPTRSVLLVHNCCVTQRTIDRVTAHFTAPVWWCLCLGSNRYISGLRPPVELLRANGLNICVGTDSLASNGALSLVDELRLLGDGVPLAERLLWATAGGAAALGFGDELGEIAPGRRPGVVVLEGIDFSAMRLLPESRTTRLA